MNSPASGSEGMFGCATSFIALGVSFLPEEATIRVVCLLLSMLASIATIIKLWKK